MGTKSWTKFQRKARVMGRLLREIWDYRENGVLPPQMSDRWRLYDKYGFRRVGGGSGFTTLSGSISTNFSWNAQVSLTGSAYNPTVNSSAVSARQNFATPTPTNAQSGGCDECFSFQQGIALGITNTAVINLYNGMTDLLQRATVAILRIKGYQIRLLSATNDPTISPAPTATSVGIVSNIGSNTAAGQLLPTPAGLDFGNNGSGATVALTGSGAVTAVAPGAAGSGYPANSRFLASPQQAGGSGCVFLCGVSSTGTITTTVFIAAHGGGGYSAATVPLIPVGQYQVYTGGCHTYFDPSANGFTNSGGISGQNLGAANQGLLLQNTDAAHAITFEIDVFGATS